MNKLSEFSDSFDRYVSDKISILNNEYVHAFSAVVLVIYAVAGVPALSQNAITIANHPASKIVLLLLVALVAKYNMRIALLLTIAVLLTLATVYKNQPEGMGNLSKMQSNLNECNNWECEQIVQENNQQVEVEGNESEITEGGYPVDFSVVEEQNNVLQTQMANTMMMHEEVPQVVAEAESESQPEKNIITTSIDKIKTLLKKVNIIEGYEDSESSSYSEF